MLSIASGACKNRLAIASVYKVSPQTIRRSHYTVAQVYLQLEQMVHAAAHRHLSQSSSIDFACVHDRWDETGQRLAVPLTGADCMQASSVWQVFVFRKRILWGSLAPDGAVSKTYFMDFVVPPIPLLSTSAKCIYSAMSEHPSLKSANRLCDAILKKATWAFRFQEPDGATGNDKCHAFTAQLMKSLSILDGCLVCSNHSNQLAVGTVMIAGGWYEGVAYPVLNNLYRMSLYLRMGQHFVRLIAATPELVRSSHLSNEPPPPEARLFSKEMIDLMVTSYGRTHDVKPERKAAFSNQCSEFFNLFNGCPWHDVLRVHMLKMPFASFLKIGIPLAIGVILPHLPPVPSAGKHSSTPYTHHTFGREKCG